MQKRHGEVTAIKDLFAKYKTLLIAPQKTVELELIRLVGEKIGITLKEEQVSYSVYTRTVHCNVSGLIKQEIKLRNKELLQEITKRLGKRNAPEQIL